MSQVTDKWAWAEGSEMSRQELVDHLDEIRNMNLDDFYSDGKLDFDKVRGTKTCLC